MNPFATICHKSTNNIPAVSFIQCVSCIFFLFGKRFHNFFSNFFDRYSMFDGSRNRNSLFTLSENLNIWQRRKIRTMETRMIVDFSRLFLILWWSWSYLVKLLLFDWSDGASSVCCKAIYT